MPLPPWRGAEADLRPMLASLDPIRLDDPHFAYEPKYDGIRALVEVAPRDTRERVRIRSRLGNQKTGQFPEIARALEELARKLKAAVVLDGEIVALDPSGEPAGFQALQGRMHLGAADAGRAAARQPAAFIAFDLLRDGADDLRSLPLTTRRARLERILVNSGAGTLRISEMVVGDARRLQREVAERGLEGLVAKRLDSPYRSGRRSAEWRKLKMRRRQRFAVGGWTEPRGSRVAFGALLLGVPEGTGTLTYVGHTGPGFDDAELRRVAKLLAPLETATCPFSPRPRTNERPHWVEPRYSAEVSFTEWTAEGRLRHPQYLGLHEGIGEAGETATASPRRHASSRAGAAARAAPAATPKVPRDLDPVIARLDAIEAGTGDGVLDLPGGHSLDISHLGKVFWPAAGLTKGDLMRYCVRVSQALLSAVADRPLVMKRFPNGVTGKAFYQQRAPATVPRGVRVETLPSDEVVPSRLIGGSLVTLLYMIQLAVISQDPWFSRVSSPDAADHAAFDLDPMPGVTFATVLDVARWIHDELEALGIPSMPKTSGADGLHIYVPLPPRAPYEAGRIFCEIVATLVTRKHPRAATVERSVNARGRRVYVDCLQNIRGKTLATAYSARATEGATVSTPLTWDEIHRGVDREAFTIQSLPSRLAEVGDLWARLRTSRPADLSRVLQLDAKASARS